MRDCPGVGSWAEGVTLLRAGPQNTGLVVEKAFPWGSRGHSTVRVERERDSQSQHTL